MNTVKKTENGPSAEKSLAGVEERLSRRSWWNWVVLVSVALVSTTGLTTALLPLLTEHVRTLWPWDNTEFMLLGGLSVAVLALAVYLTEQERRVSALRAELASRAQKHRDRLVALLNVSRIMGAETRLEAVFDGITKTCFDAFDGERVSLMLLDGESQELVVKSTAGHKRAVVGQRQPVGHGIAGWVAEHRQAIILGDGFDEATYPGFKRRVNAPSQAMVVPIVVRQELVGVLNVAREHTWDPYTDDDLSALEVFAQNAGTCIRHAEQAEWMRQLIDGNQGSTALRRSEERHDAAT